MQAMLSACDELNARLASIKDKLGAGASWKDVIAAAAADGVCLSAEGWWAPQAATADPFQYFVFCAAASTVEVDLLTGEVLVPRVDIVYDCGQSLNPFVDIGQIEGGAWRALPWLCLPVFTCRVGRRTTTKATDRLITHKPTTHH